MLQTVMYARLCFSSTLSSSPYLLLVRHHAQRISQAVTTKLNADPIQTPLLKVFEELLPTLPSELTSAKDDIIKPSRVFFAAVVVGALDKVGELDIVGDVDTVGLELG
jgi:hypothetical protein